MDSVNNLTKNIIDKIYFSISKCSETEIIGRSFGI